MDKQLVLATSVALTSLLLILTLGDGPPWLLWVGSAVAVLLAVKLIVGVRGGRRDVGRVETSLRRWTGVRASVE
jgi:cytochrome b